jgi:hypothetical protein
MKHELGSIWIDRKGETYIKTDNGTKTYYRFLVEDYLGFEIPEGYTIHHIDYNHNNNSLDNILIVPTPIHVWIHRCIGNKNIFVSNLEKIKRNPNILSE